MPTIIVPSKLEFKEDTKTLSPFKLKTLHPRLTTIVNSKHFVFDIRRLDPGKYSFPYHFHRNAEELMMILSGAVTLRSSEGLQIINEGEIMFFEMGESSAHQLFNHTTQPCTYLDVRTIFGIDIAEYPDSGKINILPNQELYEKQSRVEYNKGEENIEQIWSKLRT